MKILIIYTGGTIGMVRDKTTNALIPGSSNGIINFLEDEDLGGSYHVVTTNELIDSSDFNEKCYSELSTIIKKEYNLYDAFLVLMGTDTMAYISSLLSFCISGLNKPILFTGGQKTIYESNSDSVNNLRGAVTGLCNGSFPKEVGIYFADKWHRSVCTTKYHTQSFDAYISVVNKPYVKDTTEKFDIITKVNANIVIFKITPFNDESLILMLLENLKINAIILEIFGSGNMPKLSTKLKNKFKQRINEGLKVVITSQCMYGGLDVGRYESSLTTSSLGFLNGGSMTKESIVGKLMFLFNKKLNIQDFCSMFENSIRGE